MKRILSAILLLAFASAALASADPYRPNAGESTDNNIVQSQVG